MKLINSNKTVIASQAWRSQVIRLLRSMFRPRNDNYRKGFTLIEILVVIAVFAVLGTIASVSLFSLLRGAAKTEIIKEVKQSGDYILQVLEFRLRNARDIVETVTPCDGFAHTNIQLLNPDNSQILFSCSGNTITQQIIGQSASSLTSSNVTVSSCNAVFTCTSDVTGLGPKSVTIQFTLSQSVAGAQVTEAASQTFQSQVTLRNK